MVPVYRGDAKAAGKFKNAIQYTSDRLHDSVRVPKPRRCVTSLGIVGRLLKRLLPSSRRSGRITPYPEVIQVWDNEAMTEMLPFRYAGFYDVPQFIALRFRCMTLVLQSPFDDSLNEYSDIYTVHEMPKAIEDAVMAGHYERLEKAPLRPIGRIAVNAVAFDPTKRNALNLPTSKSFSPGNGVMNQSPSNTT
jgi:hypothetical protein